MSQPHKLCAWPHCLEEGTFRAPVDVRDLSRRQYFCARHIKEFNAQWDGLTGFSPDEIFTMQTGGATWNRPTWKMGVHSATPGTTPPTENLKDFYHLFEADARPHPQASHRVLPPEAQQALLIIDVPVPFSTLVLKNRYRQLVKQHHPDINRHKKKAEEALKRINEAYATLKKYIQD